MLVITVIDYDSGKTLKWHGEQSDILAWLHRMFPDYREMDSVDAVVEAMNEDGFYKAEVRPVRDSSNVLPPNYVTHSQDDEEDPWPREG